MSEFFQSYTYCYCGLSRRQKLKEKLRANALRRIKSLEGTVHKGNEIHRVTIIDPESPFTTVIIEGRKVA